MIDLKITLTRSAAHRLPNQCKVVKAPGPGRINSPAILPDNAAICSALMKTAHLIPVEEVNK